MKTIKVWPNPAGISVPDPTTNKDIEPGQDVELTGFIIRRLRDGDLVKTAPAAPKQPAPEPAATPAPAPAKTSNDGKKGGAKS